MAKSKLVKTVGQVLTSKKLTELDTVRTFLTGRTIRITSDNTGGDYPVGTEHTVGPDTNFHLNGGGRFSVSFLTPGGYMGGRQALGDCVFSEATEESLNIELTNVDAAIKSLNKERFVIGEKLKFLKETNSEVVDDEAFINYKLQTLLSSGKTKGNKVKEIMTLFS